MNDIPSEYSVYLDHRSTLIEGRFKICESLDKAILTLSGGALGLSMTFIKDIVENPVKTEILVTAWFLFGLSILAVLSSMYICQNAYKKEIQILDKRQAGKYENIDTSPKNNKNNKLEKNLFIKITEILNLLSISFFIAGIILIGSFLLSNM